ncbi:MAG TPA: hypothetical protein VHO50_08455 [Bacteroidales bacterium]|nr:hypothetical protein [Bacteroidales bacterium]
MTINAGDIFRKPGYFIKKSFIGMKNRESRLIGILGTLIVHLIAAIIFMSFQISFEKKQNIEAFTVEFEEVEVNPEKDKLINLPPSKSVEKILQGDNEMLNIARNLANKSDQTIDPAEYIDMVKEELIKSGKLDENNYIDEWKRLRDNPEEQLSVAEKEKVKQPEEPRKSQEMAANYKGPTRIYYDVPGRTHIYLPLPIYMCQGSGKIVLSIEINQKGEVIDADVISEESTTNDPCLSETAVSTAMISRFNPDVNSPKTQRGKLTYHFVAQ